MSYRSMSLPVRGAWVEMVVTASFGASSESLPVRGAWVEICPSQMDENTGFCRSPCGERGLKYQPARHKVIAFLSLPVRGAWVEIYDNTRRLDAAACRSPCGERGLKCLAARTTP